MISYGYIYDRNGKEVVHIVRVDGRVVFQYLQEVPNSARAFFSRVEKEATEYLSAIATEEEIRSNKPILQDYTIKNFIDAALNGKHDIPGYKDIKNKYFRPILADDLNLPSPE